MPNEQGGSGSRGERIVPRANSFVCKNKAHTLIHTHIAAPCVMYTGKCKYVKHVYRAADEDAQAKENNLNNVYK